MSMGNSDSKKEPLSVKNLHKSILKFTSIISLGTLVSRVLGFFRDVILANLLGTGVMADAFFVAFKIPNLFRDFVGEGAINSSVVPVLGEYKENNNQEKLFEFANVILFWAFIVLGGITILGIFVAPLIVSGIAPGFIDDRQKFDLTVFLTRIMFPYLILIGLTAYCAAILYTFRSFTVSAFSPCLLNLSLIISALFSEMFMADVVLCLSIGVLCGGILQLCVHIFPLRNIGWKFRKMNTLKHSGIYKIGKLLGPRILGSGVYQLTILVDTLCASLSYVVGLGGISAIYYANRIISFPLGIFSIPLAIVTLTTFSTLANDRDYDKIRDGLVFSLKNIFFILCPIAVIISLLSEPMIRILFERGSFDEYSTAITANTLSLYVLGLCAFGGIKIIVSVFYSLQDTKTPVKVAMGCLVINVILNVVFMFPFKIAGIALASAVAGTIDFVILFYIMNKKLNGLWMCMRVFFIKVFLANSIFGVVLYYVLERMIFGSDGAMLLTIGLGGVIMYMTVCYFLGVEQAKNIVHFFIGKRGNV